MSRCLCLFAGHSLLCSSRKQRCCSSEPDYEETVQDSDDHTVGYVIDNKTSSAMLVGDQMELVNMNDGNTYGAMWRSRPPSYTTTTDSSVETGTTRVGYSSSSSARSDSLPLPPGFGGRGIVPIHAYESPSVPRRDPRAARGSLPETEPS